MRRTANRTLNHAAAKPAVFALALLPMAWLLAAALTNRLGANPVEALLRSTGDWTLRLLCLTLAVTPLRQWTGWQGLARFRRMLGLFSAAYAALHLAVFLVLDLGLDLQALVADIAKRPFILVGSLAFVGMLALTVTSNAAAVQRLGLPRWQALHRAVYAIAGLALLHFYWMRAGKNDFAEVSVYAGVVAVLLGWRLVRHLRQPRRRPV